MEDNLEGTKNPMNAIDEACRRICVRVASLSVCGPKMCVCVCVVAVSVPRVSEPGELRQEYEDQVSRVSSVVVLAVFLRKNRCVHFKVLNVNN